MNGILAAVMFIAMLGLGGVGISNGWFGLLCLAFGAWFVCGVFIGRMTKSVILRSPIVSKKQEQRLLS